MKKLLTKLERVLLILCGILLGIMVASMAWQVILRYGFQSANAWSEELARYCMLVIAMLIAPIGLRRGKHVRVDYFIEKFSPGVQKVIDIIMDILMSAYMVGLLVSSIALASNPSKQYSPGLHIDMAIMYIMIAVSSVLMLIFMVYTIYEKYIDKTGNAKRDEQGG